MKKQLIFMCLLTLCLFTFVSPVSADNSWLAGGVKVACGNINNIPSKVPEMTSLLVNVIQVIIPLALIIFGLIDLGKGVMAQKEDEIKKGQQTFIKRLVIGAILFFIFAITKLLISAVSSDSKESNNIISCMDCFIKNNCEGK